MRKIIVISGIIIAIVIIGIVGLRFYTKSFSPQEVSKFEEEGNNIRVTYSRPFKKDRKIFGELVPYDKVWRTGANEATIFETASDIKLGKQILAAGSYSLFTIPGKDTWKIIFNKEIGQWGVGFLSGEANRNPELDVLTIEAQPITTQHTFEQFTINFDHVEHELDMIIMWDQTLVVVPITENL